MVQRNSASRKSRAMTAEAFPLAAVKNLRPQTFFNKAK
jgi:hypothetical protein